VTYQSSWDRTPGTPYWGTATHFRVPSKVIKEIRECLSRGQTIQAIKALRDGAGCGLVEAKAAVERFAGKTPEGPRILPLIRVKSITLDSEDGDLTVDMEGLQLMGLMHLQTLGLDECRHILGLVDVLDNWQNKI
jgi:hypothetical protein